VTRRHSRQERKFHLQRGLQYLKQYSCKLANRQNIRIITQVAGKLFRNCERGKHVSRTLVLKFVCTAGTWPRLNTVQLRFMYSVLFKYEKQGMLHDCTRYIIFTQPLSLWSPTFLSVAYWPQLKTRHFCLLLTLRVRGILTSLFLQSWCFNKQTQFWIWHLSKKLHNKLSNQHSEQINWAYTNSKYSGSRTELSLALNTSAQSQHDEKF
jgi:hypothetical protein